MLAAPDAQLPRNAGPILRVDSVPDAIRALVAHLRGATHSRVIAVTGSVGKTSSCTLLQHLLRMSGARVRSNGQQNYPDGLLAEAANLGAVDHLVLEVSLQALERDGVTSIVRPHVALLTHVSPVHAELHSGLAELTGKKAELFLDLAPGGTAVINRDLEHFEIADRVARSAAARVVTFGTDTQADFRLLDYDASAGEVSARIRNEEAVYRLGLPGRHMALNSLGVLAAADAAGVGWRSLLPYLESVRPAPGRSGIEEARVCGRTITLIDDSYNASPASMRAAFAMLASLQPQAGGRRVAILGEMLEMGTDARRQHESLAGPLVDSGVDEVWLCGEGMRVLHERLASTASVRWFDEPRNMFEALARGLRTGDVLLFKGSHGSEVHRLVAGFRLLSLVKTPAVLHQPAVSMFLRAQAAMRWAQPRVPTPVGRWVSWRMRKLARAE